MISRYDVVEYLDSEALIDEYLKVASQNEDPAIFAKAMADACRARGILQLSKDTGIDKDEICKVFTSDIKPSGVIVSKITKALAAPIQV